MRRGLVALMLVLLPVAVGAQQSIFGIRNSLVQFVLSQISTPGSFEVTAETVEAPQDGGTRLLGVRVSDGRGVWIEIGEVTVTWNAARILRGELEIPRIYIADLTMSRLPDPAAEPPQLRPGAIPARSSPFDWPRSPVVLRIQDMRLERIAVAEGILPQPIRFDAVGRAEDQGDVQALSLTVTRTDGRQGAIAFDYLRDFAAGTFRLRLDADEAPGGIVAAAAGFPPDSRSAVRLTADGPRDDWRLDFTAGVERVFEARGQAQVSFDAPLGVTADFTLTPGPAMEPRLRAALSPRAALRARVEETAGVVTISELAIGARDVDLTARGTYARAGGAVDLAVGFIARPGLADLVPGVAFDGAGFDGTVRGTPTDLRAEGRARLAGLRTAAVDAGALDLALDLGRRGEVLSVRATGDGTGLRLDRLTPEMVGPVTLDLSVAQAGDRLRIERLALDSPLLTIGAAGESDMGFRDGAFAFTVAAPALGVIARAYGVEAEGGAEMDGTATLTAGQAALDLGGVLNDLRSPAADLGRFGFWAELAQEGEAIRFATAGTARALRLDRLGPDVLRTASLDAAGRIAGDRLTLTRAAIQGPLLSLVVAGAAGISAGDLDLAYQLSTADAAPVAAAYGQAATGRVAANGRITRPGAAVAPVVEGRLTGTGLGFGGQALGDLTIAHRVSVSQTPSGEIEAEGQAGILGPVRLATAFAFAAPRLTLERLSLDALGIRLRGGIVADTATPLVTGELALRGPDLRPLGAFFGQDLRGRGAGTLTLAAPGGRQDAALDLGLRGVAAAGIAVAEARLRGQVRDARGNPTVDARLSAAGVTVGGAEIATLAVDARGPLSALGLTAEASGMAGGRPLDLRLAARIAATAEPPRATVSMAEANYGGERVALAAPLVLRATGGVVVADGLDLVLPRGGRITGRLGGGAGGLSGDLTLSAVDLTLAKALAGVPVAGGVLDGTARFDTGAGRAEGRLTGRGLRLDAVPQEAGALALDATLDWRGGPARVAATLSGDFGDPIAVTASLPLTRGPIPGLNPRGPLAATIGWRGEIGALWAAVPLPAHLLNGAADVALRIGGTPRAPTVAGTVGLSGGRYQFLDAGVILTDLTIRSRIAGTRDLVLDLSARDGANGRVEGEVRLASTDGPPTLTARLSARQAVLVRRDDVTARLSADLTADGPLTGPRIAGLVTVDRAEVRLVNAMPPSVATLGEVRLKGAPPPPPAGDGDGGPTLDLAVRAPGAIFVRGRGLDSEWKADVTITGAAGDPRIAGAVERLRGSFLLIGERFELEEGRITFPPGPTIDPALVLTLTRTDNDITGRILVTGRASEPEIGFSSSPQLPEEEVLPRLLFGTSKQGLTAGQAIQLAAGVALLTTGEAGPLDIAREALGVDVLQVDPGADSTDVTVGKTLAPGVFVGATRDVTGKGGSAVKIEVEVFEGFQIEGEVGPEGSSVGAGWTRDF